MSCVLKLPLHVFKNVQSLGNSIQGNGPFQLVPLHDVLSPLYACDSNVVVFQKVINVLLYRIENYTFKKGTILVNLNNNNYNYIRIKARSLF